MYETVKIMGPTTYQLVSRISAINSRSCVIYSSLTCSCLFIVVFFFSRPILGVPHLAVLDPEKKSLKGLLFPTKYASSQKVEKPFSHWLSEFLQVLETSSLVRLFFPKKFGNLSALVVQPHDGSMGRVRYKFTYMRKP